MILTFIGMSSSGKSYWSKRLAYEQGFRNYYCDDLIEEKLRRQIPEFPGVGIGAVAQWLGYPSESGFRDREELYLKYETEVMQEVLSALQLSGAQSNVVIDTSGSFIYVGEKLCRAYKELSKVVYLRIPDAEREALLAQYLSDPKPVLWRDCYQPFDGELSTDSLKRCYPLLLDSRIQLYEKLADISLDLPVAKRTTQSTAEFLERLQKW